MSETPFYNEVVNQYISLKIVMLSYFISVLGSFTTLELLRRRTSMRGKSNWLLLICSALSMGGVAIWSMHFLGNRAIILHNGNLEYQLAYSIGFTALSFFLPVLVLLLAYLLIGTNEKVSWIRIFVGGMFGGLAICGMHYTGQAGISNYVASYHIGYVVGSVIIAVCATVFTLILFFSLQSKWTNAWWKLAGCSFLLALSVSGMHWVASLGTVYRFRHIVINNVSRKNTIIFIGAISSTACILLLFMSFEATRRLKARKDRAQKVVLTRAIFDPDGRLLVTIDGMFISHEITDMYHERSLNDEFDIDHPVFYWIYKVSRSWKSVMDLVPAIKDHFKISNPSDNQNIDYSLIFKERFIIAAVRLAELLHDPLHQVGILYDGIMKTGQKKERKMKQDNQPSNLVLRLYGKGQMLFLVKHASRADCNRYLSYGFRFAPVHLILDGLARSFQVPKTEIMEYIESMQQYQIHDDSYKPGIYVGLFAVKAHVHNGLKIVVDKQNDSMIPSKMLSHRILDQEQMIFLKSIENMTAKQVLQILDQSDQQHIFDSTISLFKAELKEALVYINQCVGEYIFQDAILTPELIRIPCSGQYQRKYATIILFRHVIPIHVHLQTNNNIKIMPLNLFKVHQWSILGYGELLFFQDIQREFLPILNDLERIRPSHSSFPIITTIQKSEENFDPTLSGITISKSVSVSVEDEFGMHPSMGIINQTAVASIDRETLWMNCLQHVRTLSGHIDRVWNLSLHPTLPLLASASSDKTVKIWSIQNGQCIATLEGNHQRSIRSVAWKPQTKEERPILATASFDGTVGIWEPDCDDKSEWECVATLEGHESEVKSVAWSSDGGLLATCSRDKSVWIWEVEEENEFDCLSVLQEHTQDVKMVLWHPEDERLASASYDNTIKMWKDNQDDWECYANLSGHSSTVWCIDFESVSSCNPRLVSSSDDQTIKIWEKELLTPNQLCVTPILSSFQETWVEKATLPKVHTGSIYYVSWSKMSGKIVSCGSDGSLVVYKENGKDWVIQTVKRYAHDVYELNCSIFGNILGDEHIFTCGDDANINIWELESIND
ncbi:hypothetical protein PORY_002490 [Pneumocystis oryctolagi]|uniref:Uncharacterized protein n=1 Tax=Pneumocystis oryctolagi TaxID=42067 RepID=A0ACB7C8Y0_9ASCO|nr:hypothetical protein PORY_002490 [Pneumocystis oryctolagi]